MNPAKDCREEPCDLPRAAWRPVGTAILRMAGFPFAWLDSLSDGTAVHAARTVLDLQDRLAAIWQWARRFEADLCEHDRAILRRMRSGRPPRPTDVSAQHAALDDQARAATRLRQQLTMARDQLCDSHRRDTATGALAVVHRFHNPALRDALLVSNERAARRLTSWLDHHTDDPSAWRSADRQSLTTLVRYLQRLCAKNETTSHFGPFAVGRFTTDTYGITWNHGELRRTTVLSRWAALAVAESLVTPELRRPRRVPGAFLDGDTLQVVDLRHTLRGDARDAYIVTPPVRLDPADTYLLTHCDGRRTIADLASGLSGVLNHTDLKATTERLDRLAELGAVHLGPTLSYGTPDVLPALRAITDRAEPIRQLNHLATLLDDLATVPYDQRRARVDKLKTTFVDITGRAAKRDTSRQFYADHGLFSETCLAPVSDVRFGRQIRDIITDDLAPLHDVLLLPARLRHDGERRLLGSWYRDRVGERRVSLSTYLARFTADADRLHKQVAELDEGVRHRLAVLEKNILPLEEVSADHPDYHRHEVALDVLQASTRSAPPYPAMCSPDAMIVADSHDALARGDFTVVVGDAHATEDNLSHGMFSPHVYAECPGFADEVVDGYRSLVGPNDIVADVTQQHRNATFARCELPCPDVEAYDPAPGNGREVLHLFDLEVAPGSEGLELRHRGTDRRVRLMAPPLAWCHLTLNPMGIFAFPSTVSALTAAQGRCHVPRLVLGRVVLQREMWRIRTAELLTAEPADTFLAVQRLRRSLALPRHVFAKVAGQPKPVYCDLDSPLLVRSFTAMLSADHPQVELSEMLPTPDQLWLEIDGERRTSELRYTVFSQ